MKKIFILSLLLVLTIFVSAREFPKLILPGDYPDPTIMRDGEDYYMTHSPFYYAPGFLIWHSTDLVNWKPICRAVPEYKGSGFAPDLLKYNGKYYIYYPADGTNWVVWSDNIKGPWSKPIDLKIGGIDPGHIADAEGNRYLYVNEGEVIQLAPDGLSTVGSKKKVYNGWKYPSSWKTEGNSMYLESPKLIFHEGYYYMVSAEGGTAGPATSHMAVVARSKNIMGPWENSPYNPLVHTYTADDDWWSKGHGTLIDDVNGNWWFVYHAYANDYHTLGRQTLFEPIEWTPDGWCRTTTKAHELNPSKKVINGMNISDDFNGEKLGLQWTFWGEYPIDKFTFSNGILSLKGKGSTPSDGRLMLVTATDKCYEISSDIIVGGNGNEAGLLLYYNDKAYAGVTTNGKIFKVYKSATDFIEVKNKIGKHFIAKIVNKGNSVAISVSKDGINWNVLADNIDVSQMNHNVYKGFYALRPSIVSMGKGTAKFDYFKYKSAIPEEKDMGAYLMVFHKDDTHGLHMAISPDGYSFTALNDAKPVIAGDTIAEQKGIRDPHIYRGPDGAFYLAMTDLHIYAQKEGYRSTEWEREGLKYGWGNNRGLVLMKSWDLINWKRANLRLDKISQEYAEIGCAWAPETLFDEEEGKLMLYFTMRFGNEPNRLYYAYVNEGYDHFISRPEPLYEYPDKTTTAIDGDITKVGNKYHLFYVAHEGTPGLKQATSDKPNGDYEFDFRWYDPEPNACEAPTVWKRIGEDKWVLMYDCYGIEEHNFGFIETSDFSTFTNLGHFNEGVMKSTNYKSPKHGAVVHLTEEEAVKLAKHWGMDYYELKNSK